ncbi:CASP-like protein 5C1 isoform X2 [Actinidia eriantha]|uniref:CASP-like protein 5C1 isoform X2 n=1 Tax=Actinidia eriantha TaxID=165200 RepID=UPI00258726EF|nr:CASP-like protein 5C1 isoform X2 [Actinidia eriantha]
MKAVHEDSATNSIFSFLVTIMGLVIPWSLTLALVDAYSVFFRRPSRQPGVMSVIFVGDWVLSFLSLAAACSTASVADILITSNSCRAKLCSRYQLSAAMTFLSWFLSLASSLFNLWLVPSL